MSAQLRREVLELYGQLLKTGKRFPIYSDRPNRNLRDFILKTVRERFHKEKNVDSPFVIRELLELGQLELSSLKEICENTYSNKYSRTNPWFPRESYRADRILSQKGQEKAKGIKKGLFSRAIGYLFRRKVSSMDRDSRS